uniref:Metallothionein n=1 Tax=Knipowitschia caucasica TaxID=637954 RepID=A0AAV2LG03_KNICA
MSSSGSLNMADSPQLSTLADQQPCCPCATPCSCTHPVTSKVLTRERCVMTSLGGGVWNDAVTQYDED